MQDHNLFRDDFDPLGDLANRLADECRQRLDARRLHLSVPPDPAARLSGMSPLRRALVLARARVRVRRRLTI